MVGVYKDFGGERLTSFQGLGFSGSGWRSLGHWETETKGCSRQRPVELKGSDLQRHPANEELMHKDIRALTVLSSRINAATLHARIRTQAVN